MRIVHMTSVHRWDDNRIFNKMCRSIVNSGNEAHLIAGMEDCYDGKVIDGVTLHGVKPVSGRIKRILKTTPEVLSKALAIKADLYHFHATGNRPRGLGVACLRYVFTPLPTSILRRLSSGGSEGWGRVDDIVRTWNQIGYYFLLIFVLWRWRSALSAIRSMNPAQKAVLLSLFMYMPTYSLHLDGACHQRLKLPFQMFVLLIAVLAWRSGRGRQGEESVPRQVRGAPVSDGQRSGGNSPELRPVPPGACGE